MLCPNCKQEIGNVSICPNCKKRILLPHHLPYGTMIGGRYTIVNTLGEGGFGITYLAVDAKLEVSVAVKEFYSHGYVQRDAVNGEVLPIMSGKNQEVFEKGKQRFLNEAKNLARLRNETGIVNVTDFFEENNTAYIVMEYLDGMDLRRYIEVNTTLSPQDACMLLMPVMRSLEKMHKIGLIHRDISPDNIMVMPDGSVKLMDFGSARNYVDDDRSLSVMLKPGYAPEEQYRRRGKQGPWTDVYSLCATIYRCITGISPTESNERLIEDDLKKPSELGVIISPRLESTLLYGLEVLQKDRCPDMTELISLFNQALDETPSDKKTQETVINSETPLTENSVSRSEDVVTALPTVDIHKTTFADTPFDSEVQMQLVQKNERSKKKINFTAVSISVIIFLCVVALSLWILFSNNNGSTVKNVPESSADTYKESQEKVTQKPTQKPTQKQVISSEASTTAPVGLPITIDDKLLSLLDNEGILYIKTFANKPTEYYYVIITKDK